MAKRFQDTDLWDKAWFMALKPKRKCLVQFLFAKCDAAGVWSPNWMLASSFVGEKVAATDLSDLKKQFEILPNGKIFVIDFISFQYGELSEKCPPHKKVIALLKSHGLFERVSLGYQYPSTRVQEKEEDKEEDKEEETEKEGDARATKKAAPKAAILFRQSEIFDKEVFETKLQNTQYALANVDYYHELINNWSDSKSNKKVDWLAAAKNWMAKDMADGKFITKGHKPASNGKQTAINGESHYENQRRELAEYYANLAGQGRADAG